jgi:hypothetical protein
MKFIVDECTGMAVAEYLRGIGHDVSVVAEIMPQAEDHTILTKNSYQTLFQHLS